MIFDIYTLCVGEVDEGSGLSLRAETGEEGGIVKYLAGELVARRMKPGMLVLLYLVSWELGNLFPLLSGVISPVRIVPYFHWICHPSFQSGKIWGASKILRYLIENVGEHRKKAIG